MKKAPTPSNEAKRQAALDAYDIVDTLAEQEYDDLTMLASEICQTPIALVSLVDNDRQWFKSRVGLDAAETPRDISFCGHVVEAEEPLYVEDATSDERFADNPLVTGAPDIRFYAGTPLVTPTGFSLGTLCVIDREPRVLSETQKRQLSALSRQVVSLLELRRQKAEADRANHVKSLFLSRMSHELRTPLNAVIGFSNALQKNKSNGLNERDLKFASRIHSNGLHLLSLVNDILDLSKVEAGAEEFDLEDVLVSSVINEVIDAVPCLDDERGILLSRHIPAQLRNGTVRADRRRLLQILLNLTANAVKFGDGKPVEITLVDDGQGEIGRIEVRDHGPGIPADKLELVFDSFRQVDEDFSRRAEGTGLGLAISRALCRAMGWSLSVDSVVGEGATFVVHFRPPDAAVDTGAANTP